MKEIGEELKACREKKGLTVQDVAIATKISPKIISAIESGDSDHLPAKPFLRGFIQSYARFLDLDVEAIMNRFLVAHGSTAPKTSIEEPSGSPKATSSHEDIQSRILLYKKIFYFVSVAIAVGLIFFIQKTVKKYEKEALVAKESSAEEKQSSTDLSHDSIPDTKTPAEATEVPKAKEDLGLSEKENTPSVASNDNTKQEAPPNNAPTTIDEKKTPPPKPVDTKISVEQPLSKKPNVDLEPTKPSSVTNVTEKKAEEPTPPPQEEKPKPSADSPISVTQEILLEALDSTQIKYSLDSNNFKTIKLKPEQLLRIKAKSKIILELQDSGAVSIIHNGQTIGVPGTLGQSLKIQYP